MAVTGASKPGVSVIAAMHARYEVLDAQYNATDRATNGASDDRRGQLRDALLDMQRETDVLRAAILSQRLTDHQDLAIFAFHLHNATDMLVDLDPQTMGPSDSDLLRLVNGAAETVFDYVVGEGFADMERIGECFHAAAMRCHDRRNDREGVPPEAEQDGKFWTVEGAAA